MKRQKTQDGLSVQEFIRKQDPKLTAKEVVDRGAGFGLTFSPALVYLARRGKKKPKKSAPVKAPRRNKANGKSKATAPKRRTRKPTPLPSETRLDAIVQQFKQDLATVVFDQMTAALGALRPS